MTNKTLRTALLLVLGSALLFAAGHIILYGPVAFPTEAACVAATQAWYEAQSCPPGSTKSGGWFCTPSPGNNPTSVGKAMYSCTKQISPFAPKH